MKVKFANLDTFDEIIRKNAFRCDLREYIERDGVTTVEYLYKYYFYENVDVVGLLEILYYKIGDENPEINYYDLKEDTKYKVVYHEKEFKEIKYLLKILDEEVQSKRKSRFS